MTAMHPRLIHILAVLCFLVEVAHGLSKHRHLAFVPSSASFDVSKKRSRALHHDVQLVDPRYKRNNKQRLSIVTYLSSQEDDSEISNTSNSIEQKIVGQSSFTKYGRPQDINESSFGALLPIAEAVDAATGGWGLSYADLHPATPRTTVGQVFLATNFFYAAAGLWLGFNGDWFYGGLTELAGIVSFVYHYTQLEFGKNRSEVRLALLIDYFCAGSALLTGGVYMIQAGITSIPLVALISAGAAMICLSLCWVWEFGYPYIFWHSAWHILSAYTGYLVGQEHLSDIAR